LKFNGHKKTGFDVMTALYFILLNLHINPV